MKLFFSIYLLLISLYKMKGISNDYMTVEKSGNDIYLTPNEGYDYVLVWMHGLGDSALGYLDLFLTDNAIPKRMRVVLLTAPTASVTVNGGMSMTSWFDIKEMTRFNVSEDEANKNALRINKVVIAEAKKLNDDFSKVFVGGFSQGGSMALLVGLSFKNEIGGIISLSGFLFPSIELVDDKKNIPIFAYHGINDPVIFEALAKESYKRLENFNLKYMSARQQHEITFQELLDMKKFITEVISTKDKKNKTEI